MISGLLNSVKNIVVSDNVRKYHLRFKFELFDTILRFNVHFVLKEIHYKLVSLQAHLGLS